MITHRGQRWFGVATFSGVHDAQALQTLADSAGDVHVLDLKAASESLVAQYRVRILQALGIALLLLAAAVAIALRDPRRAWHVIAPMSLATLLVLAVLRVSGVSLSLFHLVAVTLAAGLGLHYALFFERPVDTLAEARRTLHGTLVVRDFRRARLRIAGDIVAAGAARNRTHRRTRRCVSLLFIDPDGAAKRRCSLNRNGRI